jgi:hypothetical protein
MVGSIEFCPNSEAVDEYDCERLAKRLSTVLGSQKGSLAQEARSVGALL